MTRLGEIGLLLIGIGTVTIGISLLLLILRTSTPYYGP